ncbi:amine oxidase catalytic domain-containing protein [Dacryopinax primogenitus]|uniref:Amine oxidase n=1 Tax=Dacryopinax primogenitus (strain DJM 731) TaxID=1858805 RepID=M5FVN5_DACPD|nr:amine oxidase catalytic domain-containing protein [Dacryopinax primogenitus]EJU01891.1 amine oxidase catalytic domain-containing protein [Dacryopinax primogenitus]
MAPPWPFPPLLTMSTPSYQPLKLGEDGASPGRTIFHRPRLAILTITACTLFACMFYLWRPAGIAQGGSLYDALREGHAFPGMCLDVSPPSVSARANPWKNLAVDEVVQLRIWLFRDELGFNLTRSDIAQLSDNSIFLIENFRPPKSDVLAYLNEGAPPPERYARVTMHHGAHAEPVIRDYLVGPLPLSSVTTIRQLTEMYHEPNVPYNARGFAQMGEMVSAVKRFMTPLENITEELFGGTARGLPNDTLIASGSAPFSFDGSFRRHLFRLILAWLTWRRNAPGPWLHPLGFFQYVSMDGTDSSKWKLLKVVYNHQIFNSNEEFVAAFHNGTLKRLPSPDKNTPSWSSRQRRGPAPDLDDRAGPRSVSFNGLRYRVDRENQYITWMGWSMYLGFDRDMARFSRFRTITHSHRPQGLSLWNIGFRGERIIYELAPQEAMAQYAGNDPLQATTAWLDRYFGMGASVRDMLPGYDCPAEAQYLPATVHTALGSYSRERAICVFELDTGRPMTRHHGYLEEHGVVKGYAFTVRSISTVGNYDYLFDYTFFVDGTIEVRLSASGYLQGGYWEPKQTGYGTRIQDQTMGSLHDHVINYKVDLDIAGTENSLLETTTSVEEVSHPWYDDDWGKTVLQQHIVHRYIATEDEALLKYPKNFQGGYSVMNRNATNSWGNARGYAVHAGFNPIHNTVVGSKRLLNNANWAQYNLAVSLRKEIEPTSSSMWNMNLPGRPTVDFHRFFDSESLDQTDLVAWISVGTHHLPQTEDVPNTRTITATSSFFLTPLNYFDYDISIDSTNAILVNIPTEAGGEYTFEDYGVKPDYCLPPPVAPVTYSSGIEYGLDGKKVGPRNPEELRKHSELYHRMKMEI